VLDPNLGTWYINLMRVIARKMLRIFWEQPGCGDSEHPLRAWYAEVKKATWATSAEIKERYITASILTKNRVVFNIGGNKYRLVVAVHYEAQIILIRFIGTHKEYDKINAEEI